MREPVVESTTQALSVAFVCCLASALLIISGGCATLQESRYERKLAAGAAYAYEAPPVSWQFTYAPADDPDLAALRRQFDLDEVAGTGTDIERAFRLLEWAYEIVPWDGSAPWPEGVLSATNIIEWSNRTGEGVNCRMKAIVLQEALLSVGIPARMISCTPYDPKDRDSHVINAVWLREENRWVWMDASFNAYPLDSSGNVLGLREVRAMLADGRAPQLNGEAVLRGAPVDGDWYFDYYMTKNLYVLISPLEMRSGYEGSPDDQYQVMLMPRRLLPQPPSDRVQSWTFRGATVRRYVTSNPNLFWAPPAVKPQASLED